MIEEAQPWFAPTGENSYFDPSIWLKNTLFETGFSTKKEPQVLLCEEALLRMRELIEIWGMGNLFSFHAN